MHGGHQFAPQRSLAELTAQLDTIEQLYRNAQETAVAERSRSSWLYEVALELSRPPRGLRKWLPYWVWRQELEQRVARRGVFDGADYTLRYPDVGVAKLSPLYHYLAHGLSEGRERGGNNIARPEVNLAAAPVLLASKLFDPQWYASRYGLVGTDRDLVEDYLTMSATDMLRQPGPLFSGAFYSLQNPDTRTLNPLVHYLNYGMSEGRRAFQASVADSFMAQASEEPLLTIWDFLSRDRPCAVLHWKAGNFFFSDVARYVAETLDTAGYDVQLCTDHRELDTARSDLIVVAPHEYCVHGPGKYLAPELAERVIHVNLEQWHTSWFSLALDKMLTSRRALDINPVSARGLSKLGITAGFLPLLPLRGGVFDFGRQQPSKRLTELRAIKPLSYPANVLSRPYDILFVATLNARRARALAKLSPTLSKYDCFLHAPRFNGPITPDSPNMIDSRDMAQIAQNAKLLLNVHQGESHYFEWHRLVLSGIAQGCVPLTEPTCDLGVIKSGEHYIEATLEEMPRMVDWLLTSTKGKQELRRVHENGRKLMFRLERLHGQGAQQLASRHIRPDSQ